MKKSLYLIAALLIFLAGCDIDKGGTFIETPNKYYGKFFIFNTTTTKKIKIKDNETLVFNYESNLTEGQFFIDLRSTEGERINIKTGETGQLSLDTSGTYSLTLQGIAAKGKYNFTWKKQ